MAAKKLKELVEERRQPVTVYHGTWWEHQPFKMGSSFHAGTERSALDRLPTSLENKLDDYAHESGEALTASVHSYELPRSAINPVLHDDPDPWQSNRTLKHSTSSRKRLKRAPEYVNKGNQAIAYVNKFEDKGSTSYVIPSELVYSGRVKHLGTQFVDEHIVGEDIV